LVSPQKQIRTGPQITLTLASMTFGCCLFIYTNNTDKYLHVAIIFLDDLLVAIILLYDMTEFNQKIKINVSGRCKIIFFYVTSVPNLRFAKF
jgi:hypothetical protein